MHQGTRLFGKREALCAILLLVMAVMVNGRGTYSRRGEMAQEVKNMVDACRQETGATESDLEEMVRTKVSPNMAAKCMRACLMKKYNLMDSNGKFNRETALQIAASYSSSPEKMQKATEIISICYSMEVSSNHCEAAEQYGKCASVGNEGSNL